MLSYVVTFRHVSTGELRPIRVKALDRLEALEQASDKLATLVETQEAFDRWESYSINRSDP